MQATELKNKKITMTTLKSFINKCSVLFVEEHSSFDGMTDCIESRNTGMKQVKKEDAIGHGGVWCVGSSRDYFTFKENDQFFGIEVYNCCGSGTLWTKK